MKSLRWLNLSSAWLLILLQRTPAVRVAQAAGEWIASTRIVSLLKPAATFAASLGAVHSLAGATTLVPSTPSPARATVGTPLFLAFGVAGSSGQPGSWTVSGTLPPGTTFTGGATSGTINTSSLTISGTPTTAGTYTLSLRAWENAGAKGSVSPTYSYSITVSTSGTPSVAPTLTAQPQSLTVLAGSPVTFSVTATGTAPFTYQWQKDGVAITGAVASSLELPSTDAGSAGKYRVIVSNAAGQATSAEAILTVTSPPAPVISSQPTAQTVSAGSTVVFSVQAANATGYQWRRNGLALLGATNSTYVTTATAANTGSYTVTVSGAGTTSTTSSTAALALSADPDVGRLINLSILTIVPSGGNFTMGYVAGGAGTTGSKPLVIRAAGPSLAAFGIPPDSYLADPAIELFLNGVSSVTNDNWGGNEALAAAMAGVGAFPFSGPGSLDAAATQSVAAGTSSSVVVSGRNGTAGAVIAEVYDATPSASYTPTTQRLINVSVLKALNNGDTLTAGFVLGGKTSRTVLIRAVGPGLTATLGIPGALADTKLTLTSKGTKIYENDNWGGDAQLATVFTQVGAFALPASSLDAVLLVTLPPGSYSATATANGSGLAIVEVYEVP